jgi:aryl-alcohol dehydrogenase-like predicted oxidoreductase
MNFGEFTEKKEAFRIMDAALDLGINFFDTANIYGGVENHGATETLIGEWLSQGGDRREKTVLGTKVYGSMGNLLDGPNDAGGLSAFKIRRELDRSLQRLQTDHVELYQMHHVDRGTPWEELWEVFDSLIQAGKIVYVGSSNFAGWHLGLAQAKARERGSFGLVSEQHKYSLICREPELEVLPAAEYYGIGVIPWSPLGGGVLAGPRDEFPQSSRAQRKPVRERYAAYRAQSERYAAFCRKLGEEPASVALAWLLNNPAVTAPIIGPRTMEQLNALIPCLDIDIDEEIRANVEEIFPGPGKPAPEAYAW